MSEVPAQYLLSGHAPAARTLIDILYDTAARYPEATGIDDGTIQLTYAEMIADIEQGVAWLAARGIGRGDRIGIRNGRNWCSARPGWPMSSPSTD